MAVCPVGAQPRATDGSDGNELSNWKIRVQCILCCYLVRVLVQMNVHGATATGVPSYETMQPVASKLAHECLKDHESISKVDLGS